MICNLPQIPNLHFKCNNILFKSFSLFFSILQLQMFFLVFFLSGTALASRCHSCTWLDGKQVNRDLKNKDFKAGCSSSFLHNQCYIFMKHWIMFGFFSFTLMALISIFWQSTRMLLHRLQGLCQFGEKVTSHYCRWATLLQFSLSEAHISLSLCRQTETWEET